MDYKDKYNKALERASKLRVQNPFDTVGQMVEHIFPELKESESERIMEDLIEFFEEFPDMIWRGHYKNDVLAWLEKQGEQKTTDKVEPKFHEGDWVVYDHRPYQVVELPKEGYINLGLRRNGKVEFAPSPYCRHWAIQDAKNGDVLVDEDNNIGLYREEKDDLYWHSYIYIGCDNCLRGFGGYHNYENTKPATKEQRDILFAKMKEAGYEWDGEKKELKKIESKMLDPDKVIEWIDEHVPTKFEDMANYVQQFKEDFGL